MYLSSPQALALYHLGTGSLGLASPDIMHTDRGHGHRTLHPPDFTTSFLFARTLQSQRRLTA